MSGQVYQLLPVFEPGDAIGTHARKMGEALGDRHGGFIVERSDPSLRHLAQPWREARVSSSDVLVYHVALASQVGDWMKRTNAKKVIDYHNITPPHFFRPYEPGLSVALQNARYELEALKGQTSLAIADSDYSRRELDELSFSPTATLPIMIDFDSYGVPMNDSLAGELARGKASRGDLIFVGRIAPNKRQEDLIKAFCVYRRAYQPQARLFLIGTTNSPAYSATLSRFVQRLGIEGVHFVGRVSTPDLVTYYRSCDAFLSMSEHEGFGVPWLEAMFFGLPVVTFAAAAIPETVGDAAVLFSQKTYEEVAALINLVMTDEELRSGMIAAGRDRVEQMRPEKLAGVFLSMIEPLL